MLRLRGRRARLGVRVLRLRVNEACGQHRILYIAESKFLAKKRRYRLPESCRVVKRRSMPAFSYPESGFSSRSGRWLCADPWITVAGLHEFKRLKFGRGTIRAIPETALATVNATNISSENSTSVSEVVDRTDPVTVDSKDAKRSYEVYSSDGEDPAPEASKREHHVESESWKLRVMATSRCRSPALQASNVISAIDFNGDGDLFATGGIARKISICSYKSIVDEYRQIEEEADFSDDEHADRKVAGRRRNATFQRDNEIAESGVICTPGKLSSLKWRPDGSEVIGCGDYDGVVMEWSVEHGHTVSERYEHTGKRVWSLDYSKLMPTLSASGSADGTVRLWSRGLEKSVSVIRPRSGNSVCSVEFNPVAQNLIAAASADANVYLYDLRKLERSLLKLSGHERAVSYVRFLGKDKLVSASIDSTLKLWDISESIREVEAVGGRLGKSEGFDHGGHLVRSFGAHTNVRHFVGLSIHRGAGILACGSETDEVYLYRDSKTTPLVHHKFPSRCVGTSEFPQGFRNYVGAVCWREQVDNHALVAANSEGIVQVFQAI